MRSGTVTFAMMHAAPYSHADFVWMPACRDPKPEIAPQFGRIPMRQAAA